MPLDYENKITISEEPVSRNTLDHIQHPDHNNDLKVASIGTGEISESFTGNKEQKENIESLL